MTYQTVLPQVFPHVIVVEPEVAIKIAEVLMANRQYAPFGSSFAITSDTHRRNRRRVWLSDVSYRTIMHEHLDIIRREVAAQDGS